MSVVVLGCSVHPASQDGSRQKAAPLCPEHMGALGGLYSESLGLNVLRDRAFNLFYRRLCAGFLFLFCLLALMYYSIYGV